MHGIYIQECSSKSKFQGSLVHFQIEKSRYKSCYEAILISNNNFALLNAELNDKQLLKCLRITRLMLLLEKLKSKQST
jgi:hypothetical protein